MGIIVSLAVILGAIIALSGFIASKKPNAKDILDKLTPIGGFLGIALMVLGVIHLIQSLSKLGYWMGANTLFGVTVIGIIASEIVLGFLLGMGLVAKLMPGEGAVEQKGLEMQKKLTAWQVPIGFIGFAFAILMLLYSLGVLKIISR